jgi:outer membrane protein OmpA-like peptidoglycan-associated protein
VVSSNAGIIAPSADAINPQDAVGNAKGIPLEPPFFALSRDLAHDPWICSPLKSAPMRPSSLLCFMALLAPFGARADDAGEGEEAPPSKVEALSDSEQAKVLYDQDDPRAQEGVVVGARGIDPGWKDSRVAERSPNLWGQTGLVRVNSARAGKGGYFDIGLFGLGYYTPDFILPGPNDANTYAAANVTFGLTLFDLLELGVATRTSSNENAEADPRANIATGDIYPSLKFGMTFLPVAFGLDVRGLFPSRVDAVGVAADNWGVNAMGLLSLDLYEGLDIPLKVHLNGGYTYQSIRSSRQLNEIFGSPQSYLLAVTSQQWFYDQAVYGLGIETPFPYVTPFVELWGQMAVGVPTGGGLAGANYGFVDSHLIATPGVRVSLGRGLHFDFAADIGILGLDVIAGQPVNLPWGARAGVSYTFSPFVAETQVEVRQASAPTGRVTGCVTDKETGAPVKEAFVEFVGADFPRIVVDVSGCFNSPRLDLGSHSIRVRHHEYEDSEKDVTVVADLSADGNLALIPIPRFGVFLGKVVTTKDVPLTATLTATREEGGVFTLEAKSGRFEKELRPGAYQVLVSAEGYLNQGARIIVEEKGRTGRDFTLKPIPKHRVTVLKKDKIEISTKIPFEFNKDRLLRAASFILDDVVDLILRNPQLKGIRIEGHTDNVGEAQFNKKLSTARATKVMDYLIGRGVAADRLVAKGYGFDKPMAPNGTEEGRAKNRRVDFVILGEAPSKDAEPGEDDTSSGEEPAADAAGTKG